MSSHSTPHCSINIAYILSDLEIYPPFAPKSLHRSIHTTYLDTTGRPAITLKYENLTDRHNGLIYVSLEF